MDHCHYQQSAHGTTSNDYTGQYEVVIVGRRRNKARRSKEFSFIDKMAVVPLN